MHKAIDYVLVLISGIVVFFEEMAHLGSFICNHCTAYNKYGSHDCSTCGRSF